VFTLRCTRKLIGRSGVKPSSAAVELPLREAALYLAENIYSLTDYQRPWVKALELFGVGAGDPVTVRTRTWH